MHYTNYHWQQIVFKKKLFQFRIIEIVYNFLYILSKFDNRIKISPQNKLVFSEAPRKIQTKTLILKPEIFNEYIIESTLLLIGPLVKIIIKKKFK